MAESVRFPYAHKNLQSCRELKKYISEGRNIVREIETDTFEENPPLFREYISAAPDVKAIMDSQFKNVKTHARLLSKAMWYEWRMKLLDGLKEGLLRIKEGFLEDAEILSQQEELLQPVLPGLVEEHEALAADAQLLQAQADELASCDQEELTDARKQLLEVNEDLEAKRQMVADLQQQLREQEEDIERVAERKQECIEEIKEAERVREDCKGWSASEVAALKGITSSLPSLPYPTKFVNIYHSQRRRPHPIHRLDHHLRLRILPNGNLPLHPPTLPCTLLFLPRQLLQPYQATERRRKRKRKLPHQPYLHRRLRPSSPRAAPHGKTLLPTNHARALTMLAAVADAGWECAGVRQRGLEASVPGGSGG